MLGEADCEGPPSANLGERVREATREPSGRQKQESRRERPRAAM